MKNINNVDRRRFLKTIAGGAATLAGVRSAAGQVARTPVDSVHPSCLARVADFPCFDKPYRVCEIFLRGGLACFETLWVTDESERFAVSASYLDDLQAQDWAALSGGRPVANTYSNVSALLGKWFGGCIEPLFVASGGRPKIRTIAVSHDLDPHEAAGPYALTGTRLGRPNQAGMASAFNRFFAAPGGDPQSVIFHSKSDSWIPHAAATGLHGGEFAPLVVRLGDPSFIANLDRTSLATGDSLLNLYTDRYGYGLEFGGDPVRSRAFTSYNTAQEYLRKTHTLEPLFEDLTETLSILPPTSGDLIDASANQSIVRAALKVVSSTRSNDVAPLPYSLAIADSNAKGKLFDSHNNFVDSARDHTHSQHFALWQIFDELRAALDDGTWDPTETMVFINTEFGRRQEDGGKGTEHHPQGYVNMLIGGPVATDDFVGDIDMSSALGVADGNYTTTDVRAAVALAAHIDPYQASMYGDDADFAGTAVSEESGDARYDVLSRDILGISS